MRARAALLALLAVSVAAGAWLFRPQPKVPVNDSCAADAQCSAAVPDHTSPASDVAGGEPQATPPAPAPAPEVLSRPIPPPPADAGKLREESDRLLAEGQLGPAIEALKAATRADPSARNHGDLGTLLYKTLALDQAVIHLQKAAELEPGNADRWITLANAYYRKVDLGKAWDAERRARKADPGLVLGFDEGGRRVRKPATDSPRPPADAPNE